MEFIKSLSSVERLSIVGGRKLHGEIVISGAKNAALPILCASLLTADELVLHDIPALRDVRTLSTLLHHLGVGVESMTKHSVCYCAKELTQLDASHDLVRAMRASILVLGPLLARFGEAHVSLPGGCAIGQRPVEQHIKGLKAMGAKIQIEHGYIHAYCTRLQGVHIRMDMCSVTGTENLLMAAVLAEGETVIDNAACEPEVSDLAECLVKMGARIHGIGTSRLVIEGVDHLHGTEHHIMPDRIETGTFLVAGVVSRGDLMLRHTAPGTLVAVIDKLRQTGAQVRTGSNWIHIQMDDRPEPVNILTEPYPAFPTDMQAQFMAMNAIARGRSFVVETIFENRMMHVPELQRMGAHISIEGPTAIIHGMEFLSGAPVSATDLRASACLIIAGLMADGETVIGDIHHLDRGYEAIETKLGQVGALIQRV